MKRNRKIGWILLFFCMFFPMYSSGKTHYNVKIDKSNLQQTVEGWGSSLCWWAHMCGHWEEEKLDRLIDYIVSEDGLNMNIFRYNIGGGDDPSHIDGHMVQGKGKRAEMEGFKASAESDYNWDADEGQRRVMLKIKKKRPDAVFEAFSNSAPYWMTYSGCSGGNRDAMADNLRPEYYHAFCDYLIDVCKHYKACYNIEFKTLEPFNESTSDYWYYKGSQEGCHFNVETQVEVLRILHDKLQKSGLQTVISASDETNLKASIRVLKHYKKQPDIIGLLGQFNTHTYSGTDKERAELADLVKEVKKPFWQSETGPSGGSGFESNLLLAQKMFRDLRIMKPQAWLDWQMVEENNDTWCMFRGDFARQTYDIVRNYYVRMQVTRFIKQGYTLLATDNDETLAAIDRKKRELVIVVLNTLPEDRHYSFDLSSFQKVSTKVKTYRTSYIEHCKQLPFAAVRNKTLEYPAKAMSITTFIMSVK